LAIATTIVLELVSGQGMSELRLLASLHAASMLPGQWDVGFNSIGVKYYGQYHQRLTPGFEQLMDRLQHHCSHRQIHGNS